MVGTVHIYLLSLLPLHLLSGICSTPVPNLLINTICAIMLTKHNSKFSKTSHPVNSTLHFIFLGKPLCVSRSIKHLGHILTSNLSDDEDITAISKDMCRKANHLLHIFSCCDPSVNSSLFKFLSITLRCCSLESFLPAAHST